MKSFKVLFMIAGFSTAIVASDIPVEVIVAPVEEAITAAASTYSADVMNFFKTLGTTVTTKGSEFGTAVSTQASELVTAGTALAKGGYDSSVTFIQENPKTVGVVATVATVAAAVAAYRKYTYGYVFYQSKK